MDIGIDIQPALRARLLWTGAALLAPWILRAIVLRAVYRKVDEPRARYQWRKSTQYIATIIMVVGAGRVWLDGLETITTVLGLVGAGLAVALNQPISNLAGWALIMARRPFEVGDRIQIAQTRGDVIDVGVFQFTLMEVGNWVDAEQSTGRIISVPNAWLFSNELANYNRGFDYIWLEVPVQITFESDWKRAKAILDEIAIEVCGDVPDQAAEQMSRASTHFMLLKGKLTPIVYTTVKDSGVMLTIRMLTPPTMRRNTEQDVWERILTAFAEEPHIDLAYPTRRVFNNAIEGKEPLSPPARKPEP